MKQRPLVERQAGVVVNVGRGKPAGQLQGSRDARQTVVLHARDADQEIAVDHQVRQDVHPVQQERFHDVGHIVRIVGPTVSRVVRV